MKLRFLSLVFAATSIALASSLQGQVQTYETVSSYSGSSQFSIENNRSAGEIFTGLLGIQSLTYNFFNNGASSETQLSAVFAEWNGTSTPNTNGLTTTVNSRYNILVNFGTFTVNEFQGANQNGWETFTKGAVNYNTFEKTFDFTNVLGAVDGIYLLDAAKTYALIISNSSGATTSFGIGFVAKPEEGEILPNSFVNGYAGIGYNSPGFDYTFSQISVIPSVPNPVPEASTVAAMIGAAFIAGLVGLRLRQRRQLAAVAAAPSIAAAA